MLTEAQKRAAKAYDEKRRGQGWRKVNLWLSADALAVIAVKKAAGLSQEQAVNAAVLASGRVTKIPVVKDVLKAEPVKAKPEIFGMPVVVDETMAPNTFKLVPARPAVPYGSRLKPMKGTK